MAADAARRGIGGAVLLLVVMGGAALPSLAGEILVREEGAGFALKMTNWQERRFRSRNMTTVADRSAWRPSSPTTTANRSVKRPCSGPCSTGGTRSGFAGKAFPFSI